MLFPEEQSPGLPPNCTVSQVVQYLKKLLEEDLQLQGIRVHGEISGYKTYPSGHCYFTLKDADAQLPCVFFKWARQRSGAPELRDGMAVALSGRFTVYERDGKMQLMVEQVELTGEGALAERFEQLKTRLKAEGLFEPERKRPLPIAPATIGIVTSLQAAALRDMLRVLRLRYPLTHVLIAPSPVQGSEAPAELATALDLLNEHGKSEVIILARGGGSIEELWAFNEEVVARAIVRSHIPVITGIGHETDFTIADFVADHRASTPSMAATSAVPDCADLLGATSGLQLELERAIEDLLLGYRQSLERTSKQLERESPRSRLERLQQDLDGTIETLHDQMQHRLELHRAHLEGLTSNLNALNPELITKRGYSIVWRTADHQLVTGVKQVQAGDHLAIQVADGQILAVVE